MFSGKRISCLALVSMLLLCFVGALILPASAAPEATYALQPTDDTFTVVGATDSKDDLGLVVATSLRDVDGNLGQLAWTWLKFDLSGISAPIEKARLNISTVCPNFYGGIDAIGIEVFGVDSRFDWSEEVLTYGDYDHSSFTAGNGLDTLDENTVAASMMDNYHFTDQGAEQLAAWLEGQRLAGTATLVLQAQATTTEQNVNIEDKELSLTHDQNCTGADGNAPILQLATAGDPLSIAELNTSTSKGYIRPIVWVVLIAVVVAVSVMVWASRKRKNAS